MPRLESGRAPASSWTRLWSKPRQTADRPSPGPGIRPWGRRAKRGDPGLGPAAGGLQLFANFKPC
eukprot:606096-Alexandrium_andersonii.AAC.1